MDTQLLIDTLSRVIHVATAITLVGGSAFMLLVLMPAAQNLSDEQHDRLRTALTARWKRFVHVGVTLFLISGIYNYYRAIPSHKGDALYHALLGTKMLIALVIFFIAAALVGRSTGLEAIRRKRTLWLKVLLVAALIVVTISGFLKVRGPQPPAEDRVPATQTS
ncbi:hypothetical protein Poly24_21400 [Rosistilla carotiformis]|uniref:Copper resistance protein D n=1 Tax=Rosistilla carotiformis TaxID=2528017 RepID=A0A518JSA2_9BACT|nr:hypothetical protein [Rosistilla carotiformis]QDV68431.1 hypothetical protein Poly24_21400 [Rosistilla carotiformis]